MKANLCCRVWGAEQRIQIALRKEVLTSVVFTMTLARKGLGQDVIQMAENKTRGILGHRYSLQTYVNFFTFIKPLETMMSNAENSPFGGNIATNPEIRIHESMAFVQLSEFQSHSTQEVNSGSVSSQGRNLKVTLRVTLVLF